MKNTSEKSVERNKGVTLIELIITLLLVATLSLFSISSFNRYIAEAKRIMYVNEFLASLNLARSTAVTRMKSVVMCKAIDGVCHTQSTGYETGWTIFIDEDNDEGLDTNEIQIKIHAGLNGFTLEGEGAIKDRIVYKSYGSLSVNQKTKLTLKDRKCEVSRSEIIIALGGRARSKRIKCEE